MHIDRRLALIGTAIGSIVVLAGCGAAATITTPVSPSSTSAADAAAASAAAASDAAAQASSDAAAQASSDAAASAAASLAAIPTPVPTPALTADQTNAVESAAQYLGEGTGWSRNGLIAQLDSSAGEGFSKADATYGVDAQGADWNAQAVLSAADYLSEGTGFSLNGLIAQLDSSAEGFTKAQATYGVTQAMG